MKKEQSLLIASWGDEIMARLTIHLQDGFADDTVLVRVNGVEVYRKSGVTTKLLLGYADVFDTAVPEGAAEIMIEVPSRDLRDAFIVPGAPKTHVGISIHANAIEHFVSPR